MTAWCDGLFEKWFTRTVTAPYSSLAIIFSYLFIQKQVAAQLKDIKGATDLFGDMELVAARQVVDWINKTAIYEIGCITQNQEVRR